MNAAAAAVAVAVTFTWLGMVLAISFLEAPLKFRAPGRHHPRSGWASAASSSAP
jgi:hypothetical protein